MVGDAFIVHQAKSRGRCAAGDLYIYPADGAGAMIVEVGQMHPQKWSGISGDDGKPIRVLRIGFERTVALMHPRHTPIEREIVETLARHLPGYVSGSLL